MDIRKLSIISRHLFKKAIFINGLIMYHIVNVSFSISYPLSVPVYFFSNFYERKN